MNTTLYRSLALLISMFALTSSFSLSMYIHDNESSDGNMSDTKEDEIISSTINEEDPWIVEMVDSKNSNSSILYNVTRQGNFKKEEQEPSKLYRKKMDYPNIKRFIKTLDDNLDSTFVLYKLNSKNVTVGVISKGYITHGYALHLFWASKTNQVLQRNCALDKKNDTFFALNKMEETEKGELKLYFNGKGGKIIEVKTIKDKNGNIISSTSTNYLGINSSWGKNSKILFWGGIFIAIVVLVYVIYKYWWLPRKKSL